MSTDGFVHGPYVHQLNKGGLLSIIRQSALRSTPSSNNHNSFDAVRGHRGSFADLRKLQLWGEGQNRDRIYIEFMTHTPPTHGGNPELPRWLLESGSLLPIKITGLFRGTGAQVDPNNLSAGEL